MHESVIFVINNINKLGDTLCKPVNTIFKVKKNELNNQAIRQGLNEIKNVISVLEKKIYENQPKAEKMNAEINNIVYLYYIIV